MKNSNNNNFQPYHTSSKNFESTWYPSSFCNKSFNYNKNSRKNKLIVPKQQSTSD